MVRLVNSEGKGTQLITEEEAQKLADEQGLDLIVLNSNGDEKVVKIGNLQKFMYEKKKKEKLNKKKSKENRQDLKEIQISDVIAEHDLKVKAKNIDRLLKDNNKVKLIIKYRGRAIRNIGDGPEKLMKLESFISESHKIVDKPNRVGNNVVMTVIPD